MTAHTIYFDITYNSVYFCNVLLSTIITILKVSPNLSYEKNYTLLIDPNNNNLAGVIGSIRAKREQAQYDGEEKNSLCREPQILKHTCGSQLQTTFLAKSESIK